MPVSVYCLLFAMTKNCLYIHREIFQKKLENVYAVRLTFSDHKISRWAIYQQNKTSLHPCKWGGKRLHWNEVRVKMHVSMFDINRLTFALELWTHPTCCINVCGRKKTKTERQLIKKQKQHIHQIKKIWIIIHEPIKSLKVSNDQLILNYQTNSI